MAKQNLFDANIQDVVTRKVNRRIAGDIKQTDQGLRQDWQGHRAREPLHAGVTLLLSIPDESGVGCLANASKHSKVEIVAGRV